MTPTNIFEQLKRDENEQLCVYLDPLGIRTAGVGHNLEAHGIDLPVGEPITQAQSDEWLHEDVSRAAYSVGTWFPWAVDMGDARYGALLNMCFNMGIGDDQHGLRSFHRFMAMLQAGNFEGASEAMLESLWAKQVGNRAKRLSEQIKTGEWQ